MRYPMRTVPRIILMPTVPNPPFLLRSPRHALLARPASTLAWPRNCCTDFEVGERVSRIGYRNLWPKNVSQGDDDRDGQNDDDDEEDSEEEDAASYRWDRRGV